MHISLPVSKETAIRGSDSSEAFGQATIMGSNFSISVSISTTDEADRIFNALADDGKVNMPMNKTFRESYFVY